MSGMLVTATASLTGSALIIIDIQTRLTEAMPMKVLARLQRNTGLLLRAARELAVPVFASEQTPDGLGELEPDIVKLLPQGARRYQKTAFSLACVVVFMADLAASGKTTGSAMRHGGPYLRTADGLGPRPCRL